MEEIEKWITPANTAVTIRLIAPDGSLQHAFSPAITESIYIHDDQLIGYKEPKIVINFRSNDLRPSVSISYEQKAPAKLIAHIKGGEKLIDLRAPLEDYFAPEAFEEVELPKESSGSDWTPPGDLRHSYAYEDKQYEIWSAPLSDSAAIQILKNMRILVPTFIEGGTVGFLDDDDVPENRWTIERWRLFLLYEVTGTIYSLAGFSTSYHLPVLPMEALKEASLNGAAIDPAQNDVSAAIAEDAVQSTSEHSFTANESSQYPCRERISQFIILPPYQGSCHGIHLYNTVTSLFLSSPRVFQITVEDPNESFDNLRDYCDLARLLADPAFAALTLPDSIPAPSLRPSETVPIAALLPPSTTAALCRAHKLIPRQVQRLAELHLLRTIPRASRSGARILRKHASAGADDRRFYFWRLLVKHRVWVRNHEELALVDEAERVGKVDSAADALLEQYEELSDGFDRRVREGLLVVAPAVSAAAASAGATRGAMGAVAAAGSGQMSVQRKRKVVEDDDDSDESDAARPKRLATEELLAKS